MGSAGACGARGCVWGTRVRVGRAGACGARGCVWGARVRVGRAGACGARGCVWGARVRVGGKSASDVSWKAVIDSVGQFLQIPNIDEDIREETTREAADTYSEESMKGQCYRPIDILFSGERTSKQQC